MELRNYQTSALKALKYNKKVMIKSCRQMGKTILVVSRIRDIIKETISTSKDRCILVTGITHYNIRHIEAEVYNSIKDLVALKQIEGILRGNGSIRILTDNNAKITIRFASGSENLMQFVCTRCCGIEFTDFIFDECGFYSSKAQVDITYIIEWVKKAYKIEPNFLLISNKAPGTHFEYMFLFNDEFVKIVWNWWDDETKDDDWLERTLFYMGEISFNNEYMVR